MWSLNLDRLGGHLPSGMGFGPVAIETGTCRGNGARHLAKRFSRVVTIELSKPLHALAKARLAEEFPHIECIHGNSGEQLANILPELSQNDPTFFFLDAHWSGDSSVNWRDSDWKGYGMDTAHLGATYSSPTGIEQCPLLDELKAIVAYCRGPAFLLIDDTKNIPAFGQGLKNANFQGEDWSHLSRETLLGIVEPRLKKFVELADPGQWFLILGPAHRAL